MSYLTIGVMCLRVARGQGVDLSKCLEIIHGQFVTQKVQQNILQSATRFKDG